MEFTPTTLSKKLFGHSHRLTVWGEVINRTVEEPHEFRKIDVMMGLMGSHRLQTSATQAELQALQELGMIEPSRQHPETHWQLTESPLWPIAHAAVEAWQQLTPN